MFFVNDVKQSIEETKKLHNKPLNIQELIVINIVFVEILEKQNLLNHH